MMDDGKLLKPPLRRTVNQELVGEVVEVADVGGEIESAMIWAVRELNWFRARKGHQAGQAPISAQGACASAPACDSLGATHNSPNCALLFTEQRKQDNWNI